MLYVVCLLTSKLPHQSWYKIGSLALSILQYQRIIGLDSNEITMLIFDGVNPYY